MADNIKRFLTKETPWGTYSIYKRESESVWHVDLNGDDTYEYAHIGERPTLDEAYNLYCTTLLADRDSYISKYEAKIKLLKAIEV